MGNKRVPEVRFEGFSGEWEERKLGDFTESYSGGTPSAGNKLYYGGSIPFIRSAEINSKSTELFITEDGLNNSSAKMVEKGDILYALYGATSGEVGIAKIHGAINQAILAIKPKFDDDSYFIIQWLKKQKSTIINTYLQGGQGNLSGSIVKDLIIPLPTNKDEQIQVGSFCKQLDDMIALHQQELTTLKQTKQGFLQKMFPKEGESVPEVRFPGFSEEWEFQKFKDLAEVRRGLTYSPANIRDNGVRVLRSSNINEDTFVLRNDDVFVDPQAINIDFVKECDILITSANGSSRLVGKHALIKNVGKDAVHGGFMLVATAKVPFFVNAMMGSVWYSKFINVYVSGGNGAIGNINKNALEEQTVLVPELEEQKKIGNFFKQLDDTIALHQREVDALKETKKAFLQKMFV
ncbi:restriction endonuclease subunit S [Bacillus velezensis]|uniref:restriction endonuclease subunit S n=1 Tax=Bacillus velezensis TaxID=492670 RepID=UPI003F7C45BE